MPTQSVTLHSRDADDTLRLGRCFGQRIDRGLVVCLVGPLGAGKTHMVRGICAGLGVAEDVLSPTFILYEQFDGRLPVVHLDLYRLEHEREIEDLGVFDLPGTDTVVLAEWGDRSEALLEQADVVLTIATQGENETTRNITIAFDASLADMLGEVSLW